MRSKCRCSCVLQFTRHHRVSSVLHRPPSQMIHCIVLCFGFSEQSLRDHPKKDEGYKWQLAAHPNKGGDHKPGWRRGLFEPLGISLNSAAVPQSDTVLERGTVPPHTGHHCTRQLTQDQAVQQRRSKPLAGKPGLLGQMHKHPRVSAHLSPEGVLTS